MFTNRLHDAIKNAPGFNLTAEQIEDICDDTQAAVIRAARENGLFPPVSTTSVPERDQIVWDGRGFERNLSEEDRHRTAAAERILIAVAEQKRQIACEVEDLRVSAFGTQLSNLLFTTGIYGHTQGHPELEAVMVPPSKRAKLITAMLRALVVEAHCIE